MTKTKTVETVYEYDKDGTLIKKTVTETTEESDNTYTPNINYPWWQVPTVQPTITWNETPYPIRYDQVTCQTNGAHSGEDYAVSVQNTHHDAAAPAVVNCDMPEDCETCSAGCKQ